MLTYFSRQLTISWFHQFEKFEIVVIIYKTHIVKFSISTFHEIKKMLIPLKAYRLSELNFFVYIKSCQYSMFYTNKMF